MISRIFSSGPDRFDGSLKNILQVSYQLPDLFASVVEQQCDHPFAL
jgi:hypothetical protein